MPDFTWSLRQALLPLLAFETASILTIKSKIYNHHINT